MRIFKDCDEAINEIERDLYEIGVRVKVPTVQDKDVRGLEEYETKEMEGYSFMILDQSDRNRMVSTQKENLLEWNKAEHLERISNPDRFDSGWTFCFYYYGPFPSRQIGSGQEIGSIYGC